jgi:DNA integrity scanning protein DisA with diadenylate cyclase activity
MVQLPQHLINYIYTFDDTYKKKFDLVMKELKYPKFDDCCTELCIELTSNNMLKKIYLDPIYIHVEEDDERGNEFQMYELNEEELNQKVNYLDKEFTLYDYHYETRKTFYNKNGFTIKQVFDCILKFERRVQLQRGLEGWLDNHIFYEGLNYLKNEGADEIMWGS